MTNLLSLLTTENPSTAFSQLSLSSTSAMETLNLFLTLAIILFTLCLFPFKEPLPWKKSSTLPIPIIMVYSPVIRPGFQLPPVRGPCCHLKPCCLRLLGSLPGTGKAAFSLKLSRYLLQFISFQNVALLEVAIFIQSDTALIGYRNFSGILFKAT